MKVTKLGWKPGKIHKRSRAHYLLGQALESQVESVIAKMKADGEVENFQRHKPYSAEDRLGRDFTILANGIKVSFGVTVSTRLDRHKKKHPDIPHFSFPDGTLSETIRQKIIELLANYHKNPTPLIYSYPVR